MPTKVSLGLCCTVTSSVFQLAENFFKLEKNIELEEEVTRVTVS